MRDRSRYGIMNLDQETYEHFRAGHDINQECTREELCDFIEEREGLYECIEADILDSIQNGVYTLAIEQMRDTEGRYIFPLHLVSWMEDREGYEWYDLRTHDSLCQLFYTDHHNKTTYREGV